MGAIQSRAETRSETAWWNRAGLNRLIFPPPSPPPPFSPFPLPPCANSPFLSATPPNSYQFGGLKYGGNDGVFFIALITRPGAGDCLPQQKSRWANAARLQGRFSPSSPPKAGPMGQSMIDLFQTARRPPPERGRLQTRFFRRRSDGIPAPTDFVPTPPF